MPGNAPPFQSPRHGDGWRVNDGLIEDGTYYDWLRFHTFHQPVEKKP
jgi:hypothetical protein